MKPSTHKHERKTVEGSVVCSNKDKHTEFTMALRTLYKKMEVVDQGMVWKSHLINKHPDWMDADDVPLCHTAMGTHVITFGGMKTFAKKKPWKADGQWNDDNNVDLQDPEVKFVFCLSCDEEPKELIERVCAKWEKVGGTRLFLRKLDAFKTNTPIVLYHMLNSIHQPTFIYELTPILERAHDALLQDNEDYAWWNEKVPEFGMRINIPKIPGQNTSVFAGWPRHLQQKRKCIHVEVATTSRKMIQEIVAKAKEMNLFAPVWGKQVKVTNAASAWNDDEEDTEPVDLVAMANWVQKQVNYHSSMVYDGIQGIVGLDVEVNFYSASNPDEVAGSMSLRRVMYNYIKMAGGEPLFAEIHQNGPMGTVQVVVGKTPEISRIIAWRCTEMYTSFWGSRWSILLVASVN